MFQALRFPPGGPVSLLLWSCCLFHVTVSQNLKCLWDHEVIGVSCVLRMAHVTVVCTFETCINQKSVIYLFIICGVIAALEALIGLRHTISFSSVHTRSAAARPRQWRRYLWEVGFECQFCVCFLCLWLEWRQSVYVKVCWWLKVCGFISKQ